MPEQKTLDNPNDIAIREQQKQQRLAQGQAIARAADDEKNASPKEYSEAFTFRFRKIRNGSLAGLWELAVMKTDSKAKVDEIITDADGLPNVLEAIGNIFANRGF